MDSLPLISIIVAIYNVEKFLPICLDSLYSQIYTNLEFILVNDGSTDGSERICNRFIEKDKRFKLISQTNRGLSAARNVGIDHAKGQYLGFVDGDDWINKSMFYSLLSAMQKYHADIATCQFKYVFSDGTVKEDRSSFFCVTGEKGVELLLQGIDIQDYVCNKLFAAKLFDGIRFPVGQVFEDISITYKLFLKAKNIVSIPDADYYYIQRNSGIVCSKNIKNKIDYFFAKYKRYIDLLDRFPRSIPIMLGAIGHSAVEVWSVLWKQRRIACELYDKELEMISQFVRDNYLNLQRYNKMGITGQLILSLVRINQKWSYWLCGKIYYIYKIKHSP